MHKNSRLKIFLKNKRVTKLGLLVLNQVYCFGIFCLCNTFELITETHKVFQCILLFAFPVNKHQISCFLRGLHHLKLEFLRGSGRLFLNLMLPLKDILLTSKPGQNSSLRHVSFALSIHVLLILLLYLAFVLWLSSHILSNSLLDADNVLIFADSAIKCQVLDRTHLV